MPGCWGNEPELGCHLQPVREFWSYALNGVSDLTLKAFKAMVGSTRSQNKFLVGVSAAIQLLQLGLEQGPPDNGFWFYGR